MADVNVFGMLRPLLSTEAHSQCSTPGCMLGAIVMKVFTDQPNNPKWKKQPLCFIHAKREIDYLEEEAN